ncbi:unnamed protein product, partial [Brassica rapa subsp. trilocularis]
GCGLYLCFKTQFDSGNCIDFVKALKIGKVTCQNISNFFLKKKGDRSPRKIQYQKPYGSQGNGIWPNWILSFGLRHIAQTVH